MLAPGAILQHYRIGAVLGQGGMGVVYEAQDIRLQRPVAIKVLPASDAVDQDRRERFAREARAASALNHPTIITVYDVGSADGVDFIVMEYVRGTTLEQRIRPGGIPIADVARYGVQIADALAQAHGAGIVHRDLKPSNIMVTDDGRIKILDFGVAKLLEPSDAGASDECTTRAQTEAGRVLGTAAYMSPEQAEGRVVDPRSDIFSFGSILYELATGRRPFAGDSRLKVLTGIVSGDPPQPGALRPSLPGDLEKVILRCLRKDPARRYQTMADLKVALEDIQAETAQGTRGSRLRRLPAPRRIAVGAAVLASIVVVVFLATRWVQPGQGPAALRAVAVTTFTGQELYPTFSPDGRHLAFSWNGPKQDNFDVYVQVIGAGTPLRLTTDPAPDHNTVWSPDGRWIAFLRGDPQSGRSEVRLVPALGGPERKLVEIVAVEVLGSPRLLAWCPDSTCLVFTDRPERGAPDAVFAYAIDTAERRQLTRPGPPAQGDSQPAVSPDGRTLVFRRNISNGFTGELYRLSLTPAFEPEGSPTLLTPASFDANHPAWLPDGDAVVFSARGRLWRQAITAATADPLPYVGEDGVMPAVSRSPDDGSIRLAYVRSIADTNIWRVDSDGGGTPARSGPAVAISSTRTDGNPQLSPDGTRVALTSNRSGDPEIWLTDLDGGNAVQLTAMGASATGTARWSPDGTKVTFNSNVEGHWDVYTVGVAGGTPRRLTDHRGNDSASSFSSDGRWVYFNSNRSGDFQIWKTPLSGGPPVQVTHNGGYIALESPDGAYVYYTQTIAAPSPLWRVSTPGGEPEEIVDGVIWRCFAVLDGGLYYMDRMDGDTRLHYLELPSRRVTMVATGLGEVHYGMAASADGRTVLYTRVDSTINDLMLVDGFR